MKTIIRDADGNFLVNLNLKGQSRWSPEYPDAMEFKSKTAAFKAVKLMLPVTAKLIGMEIVTNYGMDNEQSYPFTQPKTLIEILKDAE